MRQIRLTNRMRVIWVLLLVLGVSGVWAYSNVISPPAVAQVVKTSRPQTPHVTPKVHSDSVSSPHAATPDNHTGQMDMAALNLLYGQGMHNTHADEDLRVTTLRPEVDGDNTRANQILQQLVANFAKYKDIRVAQADGYKTTASTSKSPSRTYHFGNSATKKNNKELDTSKPNSLLYQRGVDGTYNFVGVMYVASKQLSQDQLHANFFPLSKSIWHQHLHVCRFANGDKSHDLTADACANQGGTYSAESNWMTHIFLYEPVGQVDPMSHMEDSN